jgi:hypothetical protein
VRVDVQDTSKSEVQQFLKRLEFVVDLIEEAPDQKRADLRATDANASYLIEVKTRLGSDFEANLSEHGFAESFVTLAYANAVSSQVEDAVRQLSETLSHPEEFQLLWYQNLDQDECERVVKTLYGIVTVIRPGGVSGAESIDCFYLTFSEFFRYPQVVGAVLAHQNGGVLFPNHLAPAYARFRTSRLFQVFHEHEAVQDGLALESRGAVYIADCPGSRKVENRPKLLAYVQEKYGVQGLIDVEPKHARVAVAVPRKRNAGEKPRGT